MAGLVVSNNANHKKMEKQNVKSIKSKLILKQQNKKNEKKHTMTNKT